MLSKLRAAIGIKDHDGVVNTKNPDIGWEKKKDTVVELI